VNPEIKQGLALARKAWHAGDLESVEAHCRSVLASNPAQVDAALLLSGLLLRLGTLDPAEEVLRSVLGEAPDEPRLTVNLAITLSKRGKHASAVDMLQPIVASHPELISAWNALGIALIESERALEAEKVLRKGLEHHPEHPALTLHLGHAVAARGERTQAMATYSEFTRLGGRLIEEAENLVLRGQFGEAEQRYRQLLALQPKSAMVSGGLGRLLLRMGRTREAAESLKLALQHDPDDLTSRHFLAACGDVDVDSSDPAYVRGLFDAYADQFDQSLTEGLGYRVPADMVELLLNARPDPGRVLDLGCGTGLVGEALGDHATLIDGVDLSGPMLEKARAKGCYRSLAKADLVAFLEDNPTQWDTALAADVLIYIGRLETLFSAVSAHLSPGGCLVFSAECSDGRDVELHAASGRFRHGRDYLVRVLAESGFTLERMVDAVIRSEYGSDIPGWLVLAGRQSG
jgi:predicted TPR repeat methyltransferase